MDFDYSDTVTPGEDAVGIFNSNLGGYAGLRYPQVGVDSPSRVVFVSFPFDTIPETEPAPNNRAEVLRRILNFLAPGLNGEGSVALDRSAYTIPSQVTVEVADLDLEGQPQTAVIFYSNSDPTGKVVTLQSTIRPGVFRGSIALVASGSSKSGELSVVPGDQIRVDYFDTSRAVTVSDSAEVEIIPPVVSNISVEPGYVDAVVLLGHFRTRRFPGAIRGVALLQPQR